MKSTLFLVNIVLTTKVKKLQEEIEILRTKLKDFENGSGLKYMGLNNVMKQKRKRKKKDQVMRKFHCKIGKCDKSYGTENSLNQHMKLKHIEFWNKIKEKEKSLIKPKQSEEQNGNSKEKKVDQEIQKNIEIKTIEKEKITVEVMPKIQEKILEVKVEEKK